MKIGYARVSTQQQELLLQLDALEKAGCQKIYQEKLTGATKERPQLQTMMEQLRADDVVVAVGHDDGLAKLRDLLAEAC